MATDNYSKKVRAISGQTTEEQTTWRLRYAVCMATQAAYGNQLPIGHVLAVETDKEQAILLARLYNEARSTEHVEYSVMTFRTRIHVCAETASDDLSLDALLECE